MSPQTRTGERCTASEDQFSSKRPAERLQVATVCGDGDVDFATSETHEEYAGITSFDYY